MGIFKKKVKESVSLEEFLKQAEEPYIIIKSRNKGFGEHEYYVRQHSGYISNFYDLRAHILQIFMGPVDMIKVQYIRDNKVLNETRIIDSFRYEVENGILKRNGKETRMDLEQAKIYFEMFLESVKHKYEY